VYAGMLTATDEGGDLSGIYLAARTSAPGGGGRYGVAYPAVPFDAAASGSVWLYGLRQDAIDRTNLALVNTGDVDSNPNVFTIELFDGNGGRKLSTLEGVSLNAKGWTQLPTLMAPGVTQGYARVTRVAGSNPFIAYAVVNDGGQPGERTGDGAFVPSSP